MSEPAPAAPPPVPATPPAETAEEKLKRRQFYLNVVSAVVLLVGGAASVYQYFAQQQKLANEQLAQQQKDTAARRTAEENEGARREIEAELRQRELALMIYREKKEAYAVLMDAATDVATAKDRAEVEANAGKYYAVYLGRIHIIPDLDQGVQDAKNAFEARLRVYRGDANNSQKPLDVFSSPLVDLAGACQKGLDLNKLLQKNAPKQPAPSFGLPFFDAAVRQLSKPKPPSPLALLGLPDPPKP